MEGNDDRERDLQLDPDLVLTKGRAVVRIGLLAWVVLAIGTTHARARLWADEPGLWAEATVQAPAKPRPWVNLGQQYALAGEDAKAADAFRRAFVLASALAATRPGFGIAPRGTPKACRSPLAQ